MLEKTPTYCEQTSASILRNVERYLPAKTRFPYASEIACKDDTNLWWTDC